MFGIDLWDASLAPARPGVAFSTNTLERDSHWFCEKCDAAADQYASRLLRSYEARKSGAGSGQ